MPGPRRPSRVAVFFKIRKAASGDATSRSDAAYRFNCVNALERNLRALLRQPHRRDFSSAVLSDGLRRAFGARCESEAWELAVNEAFRGCTAKRRLMLIGVMRGSGRTRLSERTYYRAKKEVIERLTAVICERLRESKRQPFKRAQEHAPIALPMVDRLVPEPIEPEYYHGPGRGCALSAAALAAEMSGDQERADMFILKAGDNVLNQFGRRDVAAAFEVSQNEFFIARCRGNLHAMHNAVQVMARFRDRLNPAARLKFALDCSEVYLYEGRVKDAQAELDFASLNASADEGTLLRSIAFVRRAQIALACRDLRAAEEAGVAAASIARPHADIRVYAAEVLGRSALHTGRPWSTNGLEECQSAFHALCVRTVLARHLLQRGKHERACETAEDSYERAMRLRYWNLASSSASTLAACVDTAEAPRWLAEALRLYLAPQRQNAYVGNDLFDVVPRGSPLMRAFVNSDEAAALMIEMYRRRFAPSGLEPGLDMVLSRAARLMLQGARDVHNVLPYDFLTRAVGQWSDRSSVLQQIEDGIRELGNLISALSILYPFEERNDFIVGTRRQARSVVLSLRRSLARQKWQMIRG